MHRNAKQRLLEYAVTRLGRDELAKRLQASEEDLQHWMEGADMPPRQALALADLIGDLDQLDRR